MLAIVDFSRSRRSLTASFLTAAGAALVLGYGFTVDDALISTRVAHHLRTSGHYGFNPDGPAVDCVTPLGWAWLLAPFSAPGPWAGFVAARVIGALAALLSAYLVAQLVAAFIGNPRRDTWTALLTCLVLATSLPFGAWATAGMETSVAMALCTGAVWGIHRERWFGPACAGLVAALRPELCPWALTLTLLAPLPAAHTSKPAIARRSLRLLWIVSPVVGWAVIRQVAFGSPVPLAVLAKPSDSAHGWAYTWGALRLLGFPVLLLGYGAYRQLPRLAVAVALAFVAHLVAVVGVGGDWMSSFRLFVPLLPSALWWCWLVLREQAPWAIALKGLLALAINGVMMHSLGPASRQVLAAREQLIAAAKPLLSKSERIASLDIGWVGVASPKPITDLAGVTDPEIARLPGGHTSKRLPRNLLSRRNVDTLVLLLASEHPPVASGQHLAELRFARYVENTVHELDDADQFTVTATIPLAGTRQAYVVLRRTR